MPLRRYEPDDRASVLRTLEEFVVADINVEASVERFFEMESGELSQDVLELDLVHDAWLTWAIVDDPFTDGIGRFRRRFADRLSPAQRRYLESLEASRMRVYSVIGVDPGSSLQLRDLLDRGVVTASEKRATETLVVGDVVAARLMEGKTPATLEIEHPVLAFRQSDAEAMLDDIRALRRRLQRAGGAPVEPGLRAGIPIIVNAHWVERLLDFKALRDGGLRALHTTEGDSIAPHEMTFDVRDQVALRARLNDDEQFLADGTDRFTWIERAGDEQRLLGHLRLTLSELRGETLTEQRASRLRDEIARVAGDLVVFRSIEIIDIDSRDPDPTPHQVLGIPPEEQAEIMGIVLARHYATWPDTPLPALGGSTPREAVKKPALRRLLVAMLRDFDADAARQRRAGEVAFDFTPIWRELGLIRSRLDKGTDREPK